MTNQPPCPNCREPMPAPHFLVCRVCGREVPFDLKARRWTHQARLRAAQQGSTGYVEGAEQRALEASEKAIFTHLKQFSTAIP